MDLYYYTPCSLNSSFTSPQGTYYIYQDSYDQELHIPGYEEVESYTYDPQNYDNYIYETPKTQSTKTEKVEKRKKKHSKKEERRPSSSVSPPPTPMPVRMMPVQLFTPYHTLPMTPLPTPTPTPSAPTPMPSQKPAKEVSNSTRRTRQASRPQSFIERSDTESVFN